MFFELENGTQKYFESLESNFDALERTKKIDHDHLLSIIAKFNEAIDENDILDTNLGTLNLLERQIYRNDLDFLFSSCKALNNLKNKADSRVQFSYKEAFNFANLLISVDDSYDFILEEIRKSFGSAYNESITIKEIDNIKMLYPSSCKKLIQQDICDGYCNEEIKSRSMDPLITNPNPISFWLTLKPRKIHLKQEEILDKIADPTNIINAYWRLKKYHKEEDVGFYDEYDFEYFEKDLEVNAKYLSRALINKEDIPLIGYLKAPLPKKVNEENKMQYRQLTYSSVFDQVIIQAIFNIIAQLLENEFHENSFGYRCDIASPLSNNIFNDWREYYPKFRNSVINELRKQEITYYICCDIKGFYDYIDHNILLEQIKKHVKDHYILAFIDKLIKSYQYEEESNKGVPQGPAYARILANLYLNGFDEEILKYSSGYFRYVDDFFLFYKNKKDAEKGLNTVQQLLNDLGLMLSEDENKKAEILKATDEDMILSKLDSIRYGIFEEFKFIPYLDAERVDNFYDAIERRESPKNFQEILEINNTLPSLLYLLSKNSNLFHSLNEKIPAITIYLVENDLFYPKRLKQIFYKIINLMAEYKYDIAKLYKQLNDIHKVYFMLSLYKLFNTEKKYEQELKEIINYSLKTSNNFVQGFGIILSNKLNNGIDILSDDAYLSLILDKNDHFSFQKIKLLVAINYSN